MENRTQQNIQTWLNGAYDNSDKQIIKDLQTNNPTELEDAFYRELEFGTGGLRGIMGVGTNRMNKYTVSMATQGLCNYLGQFVTDRRARVAIAYDSRNNSKFFADITAGVLSANNIEVFLFDDIRPTPELSFAIRHLHCDSGIVITASHNPKEYNGYKVYWNDGGQLVPPHDKNIIAETRKINSIDDVKTSRNNNLIHYIGEEVDKVYIEKLCSLSLHPEIIKKHKEMCIVYSPLHGTGRKLVPATLKAFGFENVICEPQQYIADGNFPTVESPNPENAEALTLAIKLAEEKNADLVMATDPDSDRVGIAVRNKQGKFVLFNGNMTASLIINYLCQQWKNNQKLTGNEFIVKTIVTTELLKDIADKYGIVTYDVLTGFKYIAEQIRLLEGKKQFIGGGEESYGYLIGDFVRDKDAVIACSIIAEIAAWAKEQGKTLFDILIDIYLEFGLYKEQLLSLTKKGIAGNQEIAQMMQDYRNNPPKTINNKKVVLIKDYQTSIAKNLVTGEEEAITLPTSNVLQFFLEDHSKITIRPSGTEPKIKFYFGVKIPLTSINDLESSTQTAEQIIDNIIKDMQLK
ncbi:MAG: phospho-sugar mutase [Bacteroidales bacterium]|nr:phospho-sugar mutase [Bacteroidales bacterium]